MLCFFVVLTMTTVSEAPSSFRIILGESAEQEIMGGEESRQDKTSGEEKWRAEGCRRHTLGREDGWRKHDRRKDD